MSEHNQRFDRRTVLKSLAAAGAVGAGGIALTGSASAVSLTFTANDATRTFDDGTVSSVVVQVDDAVLSWDGLDKNAVNATIKLYAQKGSQWHSITSKGIGLNGRKNGSKQFSIDPVDLTESGPYTDSDFSATTDGDSVTTTVPLKLVVMIGFEGGGSIVTNDEDDLNITTNNQPASVGGDAASTTPISYSGPVINQDGTDSGETAWLRIYYGDSQAVMEMDLSEYATTLAGGLGHTASNGAIGLDLDEDNIGDYQLGWIENVHNTLTFGVKEGDASGWSSWKPISDYGWVQDAELVDGVIRFTLSRSALPADGGTYRTGFFASAGGEEEYVAVSTTDGEFWSSANNWTSSEHWIQTIAEA